MKDNEIIKALECCTTKGAKCSDCPAFKKVDRSDCKKYFRGAIDLINRQQAEIERLTKETMNMAITIESCQGEAITEFAERLKNEIISETAYGCDSNQHTGYYDYQIKIDDIPEYIDNLVKEYEKGR